MRWPVVAIAVASTTIVALPAFFTAALAVQIRADLDLSVSTVAALFGLFFGVGALGSPLLGRLVDRIGWPTGVRIGVGTAGLVLVGMATIATNAWIIAFLFAVGGLAAVTGNASANRALAVSVPAERYGILFGLKHSAAPTATLLGGLAVPAFALTVGWQWAFAAGAVLAAVLLIMVPHEHTERRVHRARGRHLSPSTPLAGLILLAAVAALGIAAVDSVTSFLVSYAVDEGIAESSAGLLLGAASVAGLTTRLAGGFLIDRRQRAGLTTIAGLLLVGAAGLATLAAGGATWIVTGTILAYLGGWGWSGLMTFTVVRANQIAPAAATGITQTGTFVGAALGPPVVGLIADTVSFQAALWTSTGLMLTAVALALIARAVVDTRPAADPA